MANDRIVISSRAENPRKTDDKRPVAKEHEIAAVSPAGQEIPVKEPLDEVVWGNDRSVRNNIDERTLADRRLFTRVKYVQQIRCNAILDDMGLEPILLDIPLRFLVIDISMGGIGIVSDDALKPGTVLSFEIRLDEVVYRVRYEVAFCFPNDGKFRAGLRIRERDRRFLRHLKIVVARLTLQNMLGKQLANASGG